MIFAESDNLDQEVSRIGVSQVNYFFHKIHKVRSIMNRRMLAVFFQSFSSGLPLILIGSTLQTWYTDAGVSLATIGALTLVGQPYLYKFLWAPVMDRFAPLGLGRRRGWTLLLQCAVAIGLISMAFLDPLKQPWLLAIAAVAVAFCSSSQDISIDAYRADILKPDERGPGSALTNLGYRAALLVGGAVALVLAYEVGWKITYLIMASIMVFQMWLTYLAPRPEGSNTPPKSMMKAVVEPIADFMTQKNVIALLLFIVLYKLCDALALALNSAFLMRGIGFNMVEIGTIYKTVSLVAMLVGSVVGGMLMPRLGLYRSLFHFGWMQAVSNLAFMGLALVGKSYSFMVLAVFLDYFCGGLGSVAFVVFLMGLCNQRYTAAQYALFSALAAVARVLAGPEAAIMVNHLGWATFYFVTFISGMPALLVLMWLKTRVTFGLRQPAS